jgi:predicted permease
MLVVGELALAVALVAGAGLFTRSFVTLTMWRPGFEREHLLTFSTFAPTATYSTRASLVSLLSRVEAELASVPGVTSVGSASAGPLFGGRETWELGYESHGRPLRGSVRWFDASPGFFRTLGVPVVRGRSLSETDAIGGPAVGVVNETLARRFWPDENPIGKTLTFAVGKETEVFTVVGVVRDVPSLRPDEPVDAQLYWSNRQNPRPFTYFLVRTSVPPAGVAAAITARMKAVDRDLEARGIETLPEQMSRALTTPRFTMLLVTGFGAAALILAAIGTYGLLSYVVSQRRREIGIRLALGARPGQVLRSVVRRAVTLASAGVCVGLAATLIGGRAIRSLVVGVPWYDPATLAASACILLAVAAVAALVPALRASRVDPLTTLGEG